MIKNISPKCIKHLGEIIIKDKNGRFSGHFLYFLFLFLRYVEKLKIFWV